MDDEFPYRLEMSEGTFEIDRDQRGLHDVFEVYNTARVPQADHWYDSTRGRLMFRVGVRLGQDHSSEVIGKIERELAIPKGLDFEEERKWIHRRINEICTETAEHETQK